MELSKQEIAEKLKNDVAFGLNFISDNQFQSIADKANKMGFSNLDNSDDVFKLLSKLYVEDKETFIKIVNDVKYDNSAQNYTGGMSTSGNIVQTRSGLVWSGILGIVSSVAGGLSTVIGQNANSGVALTPEQILIQQQAEKEAREREEAEEKRRQNNLLIFGSIFVVVLTAVIFTVLKKKGKK